MFPVLHSHFSPFSVMQHYMTLLLNQRGLREAGSSMLYETKPHIDLTGNLACSRSGESWSDREKNKRINCLLSQSQCQPKE